MPERIIPEGLIESLKAQVRDKGARLAEEHATKQDADHFIALVTAMQLAQVIENNLRAIEAWRAETPAEGGAV